MVLVMKDVARFLGVESKEREVIVLGISEREKGLPVPIISETFSVKGSKIKTLLPVAPEKMMFPSMSDTSDEMVPMTAERASTWF